MAIDLSDFVLHEIRDDGEIALYRGLRKHDGRPVFVATTSSPRPSDRARAWLRRSYALRSTIDPAISLRVLELDDTPHQASLVLEDPGGDPLSTVLRRGRLATGPFLSIAIELAAAVARFHASGLVHGAIRSANVLVDRDRGDRVRLDGIGGALSMGQTLAAGDDATPHTAPEQIGSGLPIDARTDLYALGATLYEMLTGDLPFRTRDVVRLAWCHLAAAPEPPRDRVGTIPSTLSEIVLALLAKHPDDRYQTASGVEADLRRCRAEWEAQRKIPPFALGTRDVPSHWVAPTRLRGRERALASLRVALDHAVDLEAPALALISGDRGTGRSSLARAVAALLPVEGRAAIAPAVDVRGGRPGVIVVDDLELAPPETIEALARILTDAAVGPIVVVATHRRAAIESPATRLRDLAERGGYVIEIDLGPLSLDDTVGIAADALRCGREAASELGVLVHGRAGGHPRSTVELLGSLVARGLVTFDPTGPRWTWDRARIAQELRIT
ncbi:serine/threonine protein kinase [Sandaracinus amylolyticus]|uniref:serine/threonine protein kinase n=1 Tax=Sandaracinus amylolyticus TaxID=927083 RepID=UPI001F250F71|nr:serine/threonine-protein kinase [Sandaracinus amylolyticus]UJR83660.1 Hypothetical protein I5071_57290 [Sandaracinus amylolyticus]